MASAQDTAIAGVRSAFGTAPTNTDSTGTDSFLTTLQDKLMGMSSLISSDSTTLESSIQSAIGGVQSSTTKGSLAIESAGNRAIQAERDKNAATRAATEGGTGFAFNSAALAQLDASTDKSLKDMEQRKQELILQNDALGAGKIADLQLKAEEFRQNARQQAFSNILQMGQFAVSMKAEERAAKQFTEQLDFSKAQLKFTQDSKMADIATEFGVELLPGDTLATVTKRVQPFASAKRKAEIAKLLKDTNDTASNIDATGFLMDALSGTGLFTSTKDANGNTVGGAMPPASAAYAVANYIYQTTGKRVSQEKLDDMVAEANRLSERKNEITTRVTAEETGKTTSMVKDVFAGFNDPYTQAFLRNQPNNPASLLTGSGTPEKPKGSFGSTSTEDLSKLTVQTGAFMSLFQR